MKFSSGFFADNTFTPWFFAWPVETESAPPESTIGGRSSRRSPEADDALIYQVIDKWEAIESARALDAQAKIVNQPEARRDDVQQVEILPAAEQSTSPSIEPIIALSFSPVPFSPDKAAAALAARRRNDEEALILMLLEL